MIKQTFTLSEELLWNFFASVLLYSLYFHLSNLSCSNTLISSFNSRFSTSSSFIRDRKRCEAEFQRASRTFKSVFTCSHWTQKNEIWKIYWKHCYEKTISHRAVFRNPSSANPTKWANILKKFVGNLPTNCWSVFDYFVGLALKGLKHFPEVYLIYDGAF